MILNSQFWSQMETDWTRHQSPKYHTKWVKQYIYIYIYIWFVWSGSFDKKCVGTKSSIWDRWDLFPTNMIACSFDLTFFWSLSFLDELLNALSYCLNDLWFLALRFSHNCTCTQELSGTGRVGIFKHPFLPSFRLVLFLLRSLVNLQDRVTSSKALQISRTRRDGATLELNQAKSRHK
jgi:hypothetical protein